MIAILARTRFASPRPSWLAAVVCCLAIGAMAGEASASSADHGHGDHHVEIGMNPPPDESPAEFKTDLAVWTAAIFLVLFGLLAKFAWKPIMEGLAKREEGIVRQIAETNAAREEARRQLASYERRLAEAADEVRAMLEEARRDSESTRQTIIAEARRAADEEQARAKREIALAKDDALSQIAQKAGELAVDVAGKFLREKLGTEDQARLVRDSIAGITGRPSVN